MKTRLLLIGTLLMSVSMFGQINFKISNDNPKIKNTSVENDLTSLEALLDTINATIKKETDALKDLQMIQAYNLAPNKLRDLKSIIEDKISEKRNLQSTNINDFYEKYYDDLIANLNAEKVNLLQNTNRTSLEDIEETNKKIKELDEKIKIATTNKESITFKKEKLHYFFGPKKANTFFNIMYSENGKRFNYLNSSGINFGNNTGSVYTELASGNMDIIRLSFGAMIAKSDEGTTEGQGKADEDTTSTSTEEAYQRLVSNGGNTVLKAEYPLLSYSSNNNQYNLISRLLLKASADFPAFGTQSEDFAGSLAAEFDLYLDASTSNNDIRLYGNFNASRINATEDFKNNLGIEKENFNFARITLGAVILQKFNFSVMFKTFSSEKSLENRSVIIGGSLLF
ncbi:hypothetical protein [Flavobacterium sp.]|uniref:hypothetical protein n=1 Tax=Flavobacterium sp. TaxID=239 RepID=UPI002B4B2CC9|nr:hypothetical protein [Flavobacterium sp.]HLP63748.1 hypothetical protein [Flavobacterium sp.]